LAVPDEIKNVFISHIHEDDEGLAKLRTLLAGKGLAIRDASIRSDNPNNAHSEQYIKSEILAPRIKWAGTLLVYVTPETKNSDYVNWEIEYARRLGKRIVGVWGHGATRGDLPEALDKYADTVVGWNGDRIIDAIGGRLDDQWEAPTGGPPASRPIARHRC
jgi:hypothetical protein